MLALLAALLAGGITVVDGDTIKSPLGPNLRLAGIDAPEMRGRCAAERVLAVRARDRLADLLAAGVVVEMTGRREKFGRPLVVLRLPGGGDAGEVLVAEGLAVRWAGRRQDWCAALTPPVALPAPAAGP